MSSFPPGPHVHCGDAPLGRQLRLPHGQVLRGLPIRHPGKGDVAMCVPNTVKQQQQQQQQHIQKDTQQLQR